MSIQSLNSIFFSKFDTPYSYIYQWYDINLRILSTFVFIISRNSKEQIFQDLSRLLYLTCILYTSNDSNFLKIYHFHVSIFRNGQASENWFIFINELNDSRYERRRSKREKVEKKIVRNEFLFSSSLFFSWCRGPLMEEQRSIFHANGVPLKYSIHRVTRACPPSSCRVHSSAFSFFFSPSTW